MMKFTRSLPMVVWRFVEWRIIFQFMEGTIMRVRVRILVGTVILSHLQVIGELKAVVRTCLF